MTNYIKKLKELRAKATPGPWDNRVNEFSNLAKAKWIWSEYGFIGKMESESKEQDAELIAEMRNSLDLWLELAEATEEYVMGRTIFKDRLGKALAKLRGEAE